MIEHVTHPDLRAIVLDLPLGKVKRVYVGTGVAFVPHPHLEGAWCKVNPCVVRRACPLCKAVPGELCLSRTGKRTVGHHHRRLYGEATTETP